MLSRQGSPHFVRETTACTACTKYTRAPRPHASTRHRFQRFSRANIASQYRGTLSSVPRVVQPWRTWKRPHMGGWYCEHAHLYTLCSFITREKKELSAASSLRRNSSDAVIECRHGDCCSICVRSVIGAIISSETVGTSL